MTERELMEATEAEAQMSLQDRVIQETADAMNLLESTVYSMRDAMSGRYAAYAAEAAKGELSEMFNAIEEWLYEDGMDAEKAVYDAKLADLTAKTGPIVARDIEASERPSVLRKLDAAITTFANFAAADEEDKVSAAAAAAREWLDEARAKLDGAPPTEEP